MLSSHPCSSEGVLLLSSIVLDDAAAAPIASMLHLHFTSHLASNGRNMWEMKHTGELHMLWMHVDGSP